MEKDGIRKWIGESLLQRRPKLKEDAALRERLLRDFEAAAKIGKPLARQYLSRLNDHYRWWLLKFASPELHSWLLAAFKDENLAVTPPLDPVRYPELPEGLLAALKAWEDKNRRRLEGRINKGHQRSPTTLRRMMREPISFASFLAKRGVDRWEIVSLHDRIAYAKTRQRIAQQPLNAFLEFVDRSNPFKSRRNRPQKKAQKILREARQTPILKPDELEQRLHEAKTRLTDEQYLIYWLVAKVGLTAKVALGLTLDQVTINNKERLVICPAEAWFALPGSQAKTMEALARRADSSWPYDDPSNAASIPFLSHISTERTMGKEIFQREAILLRSSAIHAAMHEGQLNRKTLSAMTGVSLQTISNMEFLVPADIHSLMSSKSVSARNKVILGKDDE